MTRRKITQYAIYTVAILSATLINEFIIKYVKKHINEQGYILVLMDMLIVVLIFTPTFALVSKFTKKFSKSYIKTSKKITKNNTNGTLIGFLVAFTVLFVLFALLRHNINIINDFKSLLIQ